MIVGRNRKFKSAFVILGIIFLMLFYIFGSFKNHPVDAAEKVIRMKVKQHSETWTFDADAYVGASVQVDQDPYAQHAFNVHVSNTLSMDRSLKDLRNPNCKKDDMELPADASVSVIISFHNEARSALLRTIVSVLNRSPYRLLKEIVLVDDFSEQKSDGELLTGLPKVKLVRNVKREGIARSRARGFAESKGQYLVFLDSHCEVNVGWMEHLLHVIRQDHKTLASPVIDSISMDDFKYKASSDEIKGGFDWSLNFQWLPMSALEKSKRNNPAQTFKSPVLPGGLFMAERSWLSKIGGFDEGLEIWGTENIELSLKTWMCGGQVIVVPCSRVGHVFRNKHPYSFAPQGGTLVNLMNSHRLADAWLEDYKEYFYEAKPLARKTGIGSVDSQLKTKQMLKCRSFQWYLDEIYPEMKPYKKDALAYGQLQQGNLCLLGTKDVTNMSVFKMQDCSHISTNQEWMFLKSGTVQQGTDCLAVDSKRQGFVHLQSCSNDLNQKWIRKQRFLIHSTSGLCLESSLSGINPTILIISSCRPQAYNQKWDFTLELQKWGDR